MKTMILLLVLIPLLALPLCAHACSTGDNCKYAAEGGGDPFNGEQPPAREVKPKTRGFAGAEEGHGEVSHGADHAGEGIVKEGAEPLKPGHTGQQDESSADGDAGGV